jgi:hypothetical protein
VPLYKQPAAEAVDDVAPSNGLTEIAARWENLGGWSAPLRNPLWVEREDGTPVAAVSGSFEQLMSGDVERRRQAIAHAPEDIRALLAIIQELRQGRPKAPRRGPHAGRRQARSELSAA